MQSSAGVFIDIDGVVLHGGKPFEWSKSAIHVGFFNVNLSEKIVFNRNLFCLRPYGAMRSLSCLSQMVHTVRQL